MGFADKLKKLNAHRLQQSVKATVQSNGRLTFTVEATKEMELDEEKSLIIFAADGGDLGATISIKGDPDAFVLKKCGQYYYVAFKNYLQETGVDYKSQRIIYDITQLDERLDGRTLWKFERRVLPRVPEQLPLSAPTDNGEGNGDGTGSGKGAGCGAGNGDGSGSGEPMMPEDDDLPPDAPEAPDTPSEPPALPPMPPPPPTRPTRPMPPPPMRPDAPSADDLADRVEEFADKAMKNLSQEEIAQLSEEALMTAIKSGQLKVQAPAVQSEDKADKGEDWSF